MGGCMRNMRASVKDLITKWYEKGQKRGFPGGAVIRNHLPMQGTRVRSLVREDPTCRGATKPVRHNY